MQEYCAGKAIEWQECVCVHVRVCATSFRYLELLIFIKTLLQVICNGSNGNNICAPANAKTRNILFENLRSDYSANIAADLVLLAFLLFHRRVCGGQALPGTLQGTKGWVMSVLCEGVRACLPPTVVQESERNGEFHIISRRRKDRDHWDTSSSVAPTDLDDASSFGFHSEDEYMESELGSEDTEELVISDNEEKDGNAQTPTRTAPSLGPGVADGMKLTPASLKYVEGRGRWPFSSHTRKLWTQAERLS